MSHFPLAYITHRKWKKHFESIYLRRKGEEKKSPLNLIHLNIKKVRLYWFEIGNRNPMFKDIFTLERYTKFIHIDGRRSESFFNIHWCSISDEAISRKKLITNSFQLRRAAEAFLVLFLLLVRRGNLQLHRRRKMNLNEGTLPNVDWTGADGDDVTLKDFRKALQPIKISLARTGRSNKHPQFPSTLLGKHVLIQKSSI